MVMVPGGEHISWWLTKFSYADDTRNCGRLVALEESGRPLFAVHRNGWWLVCLGEGEAGVVVWVMVISG